VSLELLNNLLANFGCDSSTLTNCLKSSIFVTFKRFSGLSLFFLVVPSLRPELSTASNGLKWEWDRVF
jgi:hypothetical protein